MLFLVYRLEFRADMANLRIKAVGIHAEIPRGVSEPDESLQDCFTHGYASRYDYSERASLGADFPLQALERNVPDRGFFGIRLGQMAGHRKRGREDKGLESGNPGTAQDPGARRRAFIVGAVP